MLSSWSAVVRSAGIGVTLPSNVPLVGCTRRVYSWTPGQDWTEVVAEQEVEKPRVNLESTDGDYVVKVGGVRGNSLVMPMR